MLTRFCVDYAKKFEKQLKLHRAYIYFAQVSFFLFYISRSRIIGCRKRVKQLYLMTTFFQSNIRLRKIALIATFGVGEVRQEVELSF